ncbi:MULTISPECIES: helix-turn-helix domain-containing protein [unclassified Pseudomonas]|uniref:helix-turn-helix domain-containing protein n=1 Tax=unclassified Pseudomonas TaxID=196821 RepID=UPI003917FD71
MPLSSLCVFESTGRTGSFIQAARELGISPSAVSDSIRKLEESIDIQLFERTTREVNLTPKGRLLVEHLTPQCSPALASRIGSPQAMSWVAASRGELTGWPSVCRAGVAPCAQLQYRWVCNAPRSLIPAPRATLCRVDPTHWPATGCSCPTLCDIYSLA